jgi:DNA-binding GntR family transcriptional regulator
MASQRFHKHDRCHRITAKLTLFQPNYPGVIEDELHLHSWSYELSGHQLLLQSWNRLMPNLQFYFAMHQQAHDRPGPKRHAHDIYLELACGDDLEAMLEHLLDHMRQGLEATMSFISDEKV